jgi:hypothetical protein
MRNKRCKPSSKGHGFDLLESYLSARGMGFIPVNTFAEAMQQAGRHVGVNLQILCTPECFSGGVVVLCIARPRQVQSLPGFT